MSHGNETHNWEIQSTKTYYIWGEKVQNKNKLIRVPKSLTHHIP